MGFGRHKSTGDMLMTESAVSRRKPFAFEFEDQPAGFIESVTTPAERRSGGGYNEPRTCELKIAALKQQDQPEEEEFNHYQSVCFDDEPNNNNNNNTNWLGNKWSSCKFLGSGPQIRHQQQQQQTNKREELRKRPALCKSAADFLSLVAGVARLQEDKETRWSGTTMNESDWQGDFGQSKGADVSSSSRIRSQRRQRRRERSRLRPNGARRRPSRVEGSLSRSSPVLCRPTAEAGGQELSRDSEEAEGSSQTKPPSAIVVEMAQFEGQRSSQDCAGPESLAIGGDDNAGQMRGVGGEFYAKQLEQSRPRPIDSFQSPPSVTGAGIGACNAKSSQANGGREVSATAAAVPEKSTPEATVIELDCLVRHSDGNQEAAATDLKQQATTTNKLRMVELNGKLLDWRQALPALPTSSGFYKVAQRQQAAGPADKARQPARQEVVGSNNAISPDCQGNRVAEQQAVGDKRVSRFARPGRSPVSLQRQTNARLARHRLRIQQQRQEQLAQLAIRSPKNLRISTSRARQEPEETNPNKRVPIETLNRLNGLLGSSNQLKTAREAIAQGTTSRPPVPGIEICDNQRACSSQALAVPSRQTNRYSRNQNAIPLNGSYILTALNMSQQPVNYNLQDDLIIREDELALNGDANEDSKTISSTEGSTYSLNRPFCKICHVDSSKPGDKLISPCRCSGTMQYIHCGCLLKWLKISNKTNEKPINCELCAHEYTWHKRFNYKHIRLPKLSLKDLILHIIFLLAIGVMLFSALTPMLTTRSNKSATMISSSSSNQPVPTSSEQSSGTAGYRLTSEAIASSSPHQHMGPVRLVHEERMMLLCAASFFVSFFLAIYVQTKTRDTLYGFVVKFLNMNQTFYITEYDHGQLTGTTGSSNSNNNNNNNNNGAAINNGGSCNNKESGRCQVQQYGKS